MIFHGLGRAAAPVQLEAAQQALNSRLPLLSSCGTLAPAQLSRVQGEHDPLLRLAEAVAQSIQITTGLVRVGDGVRLRP